MPGTCIHELRDSNFWGFPFRCSSDNLYAEIIKICITDFIRTKIIGDSEIQFV